MTCWIRPQALLGLVAALAPDVVLMGLRMPGQNGISTIRVLKAAHPRVRVLVLTHVRHRRRCARRDPRRGAGSAGRPRDRCADVARGRSNKEVARVLHLSEATVKAHLLHIYAKSGLADRTAAVTTALERGIIRIG